MELSDKQFRFLQRIAGAIPGVVKAVEKGNYQSERVVGTRTLKDGRTVRLKIVAEADEDRHRVLPHFLGRFKNGSKLLILLCDSTTHSRVMESLNVVKDI